MTLLTFSTVPLICIFISSITGSTADVSACTNGTFDITVFTKIYDNQGQGAVIYTYPSALSGLLRFESTCSGLRIDGSRIILTMTKQELYDDCEKPSGECKIICGDTNSVYRGSLFRSRVAVNEKGPTFSQTNYVIDQPESIRLNSIVFAFGENDIIRHDCYNPKDRVFTLQNVGKRAFNIQYPGKILLQENLDYESGDRKFSLNITLNNTNRFAYTTIQVNVIDVDDMDPAFDNDEYILTVTENVNNSLLWIKTSPVISAHDRDTGGGKQNIEYSKIDSVNSDIFEINQTSGEITIKKILDREERSLYNFKIKVYQTNDYLRSATAILDIIVVDQNDHPPVFDDPRYYATVEEHSHKGTFVTRIHASDKDSGNNSIVVYSIINKQNMFEINATSGEIYVNDPITLDRENVTNPVVLLVRATDAGMQQFMDNATVEITLLDTNDNSPVFSREEYHFNSSTSKNVGQVNATDPDVDENGKVEYFIELPPDSFVTIDEQTGMISSPIAPQSDTTLKVKACDSPKIKSSRRCSFALVYIHTTDLQMTNLTMQATIIENLPVGTLIQKVQVTGHSYNITENNVPFTIDPYSGVISTSSVLDYEDGHNLYTFSIYVLNKDKIITARITMTVTVLDTNDNSPVFTQPNYIFTVPDKTVSNINVGTVKATDKDTGNNSRVYYTIENGINSNKFQINEKGEIMSKNLATDDKNFYQIYVKATDWGIPQLSSYAQVLITKVNIVGTLVKIGTPLTEEKLLQRKSELEGKISVITNVHTVIDEVKGVDATHLTRSHMFISGIYKNGTTVPAVQLQMIVLHHIVEIEALFGNQNAQFLHVAPDRMSAAEIALIVISGTIFFGSILLILLIRRQWSRKLKFERLQHNLFRKSSLYESQEIKVRLDDETSDYAGSLNTQEIENSQNSTPASLNATAFSNPVYENVHGPAMIISPTTVAATNEALESLKDLAERLNEEENTTEGTCVDNIVCNQPEEAFVKESETTRIKMSIENYENVEILNDNFDIDRVKNSPKVKSTNLMTFESNSSLNNHDYENGESESKIRINETNEPSIDYNDKQVRFSSTVLDTEEDIFKPLKEEAISPDNFNYNSDAEDRDAESMGSSFPDLLNLIRHSESDETDRADEEINSPIDFLKLEEVRHNPADNGTFHFGFSRTGPNELTKL